MQIKINYQNCENNSAYTKVKIEFFLQVKNTFKIFYWSSPVILAFLRIRVAKKVSDPANPDPANPDPANPDPQHCLTVKISTFLSFVEFIVSSNVAGGSLAVNKFLRDLCFVVLERLCRGV